MEESGGGGIFTMIIYLAITVAMIAGLWKTFEKAGEPGWAAIIPIYNIIVMLKIVDRPMWWILLFLCVGPVGSILVGMDLGENFGKSKAWGAIMLGILGVIGFPMIGFGSDQYTRISRQ
ncbi:MAG: signal peptidase I [Leptonema sp. (in: Bacteria)]|nr:signal peptidase I [Leptonema sp. (in: bacteria)]